MPTREARLARWQTYAYATWTVIGAAIVVYFSLRVLGRISPALAPFVLAFLLVFMLQGPVERLEKRGVPRGWAVAWWVVFWFVIITVLLVFIAPPIGRQIMDFVEALPGLVQEGQALVETAQQQVSDIIIPGWLRIATASIGQSLSNIAVTLGNAAAKGLLTAGSGIATVVFDLFLGLVIAFWTTKDLPKIRQELRTLAGEKYEDDLENLLTTIGKMVGGYVKGQTIASLVTGTLAAIGLAIINVPYAVVIGLVTFVFNYVPYIGPFVAGLLAAGLGLLVSPWTALGAILIVLAAQNVTDILVTPRVMSDQVDLHPTLVIFSLLVGGTLFGFWGLIFSIPIAATLKALFVYYWERRTRKQLATEDGALFKMATCEDGMPEPCAEQEGAPGAPDLSHAGDDENPQK